MDSQNLTYYQVLQVDRNADRAVIDASYRRLARIYHPDYNDSAEALSMMQQLNVAYSTLRDPNERSAYDTQLALLNEHAARFTKSTDLFATNSWLAVPSIVAVFLFIFVLFFNLLDAFDVFSF